MEAARNVPWETRKNKKIGDRHRDPQNIETTRMHSSRMRTDRGSGHLGGWGGVPRHPLGRHPSWADTPH